MKSRKRHKRKKARIVNPLPANPTASSVTGKGKGFPRALAVGGGILLALALVYWIFLRPNAEDSKKSQIAAKQTNGSPETNPKKEKEPAPEVKKQNEPDSFLEAFGKEVPATAETKGGLLSNEELEKRFQALEKVKDDQQALEERVKAWEENVDKKEFLAAMAERKRLQGLLNTLPGTLEKEIARARKSRPTDPVVRWLTAELMIFIGAEPESILPHLQSALKGGLERPRLLACLAQTEAEANQLTKAYQTAGKALDGDNQDRHIWRTFGRTAFQVEKFSDVILRMDRAFPEKRPEWANLLRRNAIDYLAHWQVEQQLRQAEVRANLPQVRVVVEHRHFERGPMGEVTGKIAGSGTGEFIVELFEDQAPATVANFLSLVAQKSYDGTRFYQAVSAALVAGGDPQSKTIDPKEDGLGGPGYVIPDEFDLPAARRHFRGSLSMVNGGPHTAGSQFFITLVPRPDMDGSFTVFGRVIKGMEVVDAITRGRTNTKIGQRGQIIPGDLLVRAEVLRKRDHEYRVIKEKAK